MSRSVSEGPFDFEITRVDCNCIFCKRGGYITFYICLSRTYLQTYRINNGSWWMGVHVCVRSYARLCLCTCVHGYVWSHYLQMCMNCLYRSNARVKLHNYKWIRLTSVMWCWVSLYVFDNRNTAAQDYLGNTNSTSINMRKQLK